MKKEKYRQYLEGELNALYLRKENLKGSWAENRDLPGVEKRIKLLEPKLKWIEEAIYNRSSGEVLEDEIEMESVERRQHREEAEFCFEFLWLPVILDIDAGEPCDMETEMHLIKVSDIIDISVYHYGYYSHGGTSQNGSVIAMADDSVYYVDLAPTSIKNLLSRKRHV